jgi:hypothetical protein
MEDDTMENPNQNEELEIIAKSASNTDQEAYRKGYDDGQCKAIQFADSLGATLYNYYRGSSTKKYTLAQLKKLYSESVEMEGAFFFQSSLQHNIDLYRRELQKENKLIRLLNIFRR